MPTIDESAPGVLAALTDCYIPPAPADVPGPGPFAPVLAVLLARSLEPRRVSAALETLREAGLIRPEDLAQSDPREIVTTLKAGGVRLTPKVAAPFLRFARWFVEQDRGPADSPSSAPTDRLRDSLLAIHGIGPATADAILLLGLGRATYPVDRASYRIAVRHGWLDPSADYEEAASVLGRLAPGDPARLARLADGLERVGRDFCRPTVAHCDRCPLRPFLPEGGPREPE